MTTVHWITDHGKSVSFRTERFDTKRIALDAISRVKISGIRRLPNEGGRAYNVMLAVK